MQGYSTTALPAQEPGKPASLRSRAPSILLVVAIPTSQDRDLAYQSTSLPVYLPLLYIFSGAVIPISASTRATVMRAASHRRSRALLSSRSAGLLDSTRQSR